MDSLASSSTDDTKPALNEPFMISDDVAKEFAYKLAMDFCMAGIVAGLVIGFITGWFLHG